MNNSKIVEIKECWCGSSDLETFNEQYKKCRNCATLINTPRQISSFYEVKNENDDESFYGKNYWMGHQTQDLGHPSIFQRSRKDLTERCLYWLQTVLRYKLPDGDTLEIGSGPGAFVQMLKQVGFKSRGLELSPWVAQYGSQTHGVEIINSKIEDVSGNIKPNEMVVMMDVLEHFTDPLGTMSHIKKVLACGGMLVIQTPCYNHLDYQQMLETGDPFLIQLKDQEHLFLFSKEAVTMLLKDLGLENIQFIDPLFPYDMFLVASAESLPVQSEEQVVEFLSSTPEKRLILAMIDLYNENNRLYREAEMRLRNNEKLEQALLISEQDRNERLRRIIELEKLLKASEDDRNQRLFSIQKMEKILEESEQDRENRLLSIQKLEELLRESERDRQARLESIHILEGLLKDKAGGGQE